MPQVFKAGAYWVYFWSREGAPIEPIHVHIAEGRPCQDGTKVWITRSGNALLCNNDAGIEPHTLRQLMRIIEARHTECIEKWKAHFGEIKYYC